METNPTKQVKAEIKEDMKIYLETNENGNAISKVCAMQQKLVLKDGCLQQNQEKTSSKQLDFTPKGIR